MSFDPRQRFKDNKVQADQWGEISASALFAVATEAALVIMVNNMTPMPEMTTASANAWRLQGARDYLLTLQRLASSDPVPKPRTTGIDYTQKQ